MIKIGIDLATKSTGIVILDGNNEFIGQKLILTKSYSEDNLIENTLIITKAINSFIETSLPIEKIENEEFVIGFEMNWNDSHFSLYMGLYIQPLIDALKFAKNIEFKVITAGTWQYKIGCVVKDKSIIRKEKAREFCFEKLGMRKTSWSNDITDAYCIAYLIDKIISPEKQKKLFKEIKQWKKKTTSQNKKKKI